jgi:hypothetical protein
LTVPRGAALASLAWHYGLRASFLKRINPRTHWPMLRQGAALKVVRGPFRLRVVMHAARLDLYARGMYVCSFRGHVQPYAVALGQYRVASRAAARQLVRTQGPASLAAACMVLSPVAHAATATDVALFDESRVRTQRGIALPSDAFKTLRRALVPGRSRVRLEP